MTANMPHMHVRSQPLLLLLRDDFVFVSRVDTIKTVFLMEKTFLFDTQVSVQMLTITVTARDKSHGVKGDVQGCGRKQLI